MLRYKLPTMRFNTAAVHPAAVPFHSSDWFPTATPRRALSSAITRRQKTCRTWAPGAQAHDGREQPKSAGLQKFSPVAAVTSLFKVYSDEKCNAKFLALAVGQTLASVATLLHDSYLPVYVQDELGLSNTEIGAVQGIAQFLCQLCKGASGVVGDLVGSQVRVLFVGMGLTLGCKFMFPLLAPIYAAFGVSVTLAWFFLGKLMDRMSKGIREAPTKAIMNELAKESGDAPDAAYGLRQSLATAGALVGSGTAALVFASTGQSYVLTFTAAIVPPAIAVWWLWINFGDDIMRGGKPKASAAPPAAPPTEPPQDGLAAATVPAAAAAVPAPAPVEDGPKLSLWEKTRLLVGAFKPVYWQALLVVSVLYFARFDASFLVLRAKQVIPKTMLPLMTLVIMLTQTILTAPLAKLSGSSVRVRNRLLLVGFAVMVACDAVFGLASFATPAGMFLGACLLGLHMAMTHSITISMIAAYMPTGTVPGLGKLSGTAVSFTDLLLGFVLVASNAMAGILCDYTVRQGLGNVGCFAGGAAACCLAALLLIIFERFGQLGDDSLVTRRKPKTA